MHSQMNVNFQNKMLCYLFKWEPLSLRLFVAEHGSFHGQVDLHTPATAQAGATLSLTLTVRALDSPDSNYAVAYLTVIPPVRKNWT